MPSVTKVTKKVENEFLSRTANGESMIAVCRALGVSRMAIYRLSKRKPSFAQAWDEAREDARLSKVLDLEKEADRRAVEGVTTGVFRHRGKTYLKRRYSDTLLLARLKALDQEKYGDRAEHKHAGSIGVTVRAEPNAQHLENLEKLSIDDQRQVLEIIQRARKQQEADGDSS